jgi:hypothetical protein
MPFSIEGWVEVSRRGSPAEQAWESLIRIGSLIDVADEVSERLFGLSKRSVSAGAAVAAVLPGVVFHQTTRLRCAVPLPNWPITSASLGQVRWEGILS